MAGSTEPAYGKLRQAERHLETLERLIRPVVQANPVRITVDRDIQGRAYTFYVWNVPPPEPDWGHLAGDCFHNLRSALDHLAYQLAVLGHGGELSDPDARKIQFPVCSCDARFNKEISRRKRLLHVPTLAETRIRELQPYNAYDESIWGKREFRPEPCAIPTYIEMISGFDNTDKHRSVHPAWLAFDPGFGPPNEFGLTSSTKTVGPLNEGAQVGKWEFPDAPPPVPREMDMKAYFPVAVSLGQPQGPLLMGTLHESLSGAILATRMVVAMFEPCFASHGAPPAPLRFWDGTSH